LANYQVDISVDLPYLTFNGEYEVSGRLLVLPLKGKGPVKANASEYSTHCPLRPRQFLDLGNQK
jgi:hypothetical protein